MVVANNTAPPNTTSAAPVRIAGTGKVTLAGCHFLNNHYALYVLRSSSKVTITYCTFSGNFAFTRSYGGGAAIYAGAAEVMEINNSTFFNDFTTGVASSGGAIYTGTNTVLQTVTFVGNYVVGAMAGGGAVWVDNRVEIMVRNVNFTGNWVRGDASEGGAIYARNNSAVSVVGGSMERNMAIGERARGELGDRHMCRLTPPTFGFMLLLLLLPAVLLLLHHQAMQLWCSPLLFNCKPAAYQLQG
jgi:hypothetical protein